MKMLSEGAEAKIYSTALLGIDAVVKRRIPKNYRVKRLDLELRRQRTRTEARAMTAAETAGVRVPELLLVDEFDIFMSRIKGARLSDEMAKGRTHPGAIRDAGAYLGRMHLARIAHGDFTPANIMLEGSKTYVIDFGLSAMNSSIEEMALDLVLMKRSLDNKGFSDFIRRYKETYRGNDTLKRLAAIETRGRYQTRTMAAVEG